MDFDLMEEWKEQQLIYNGILFNNQVFAKDFSESITYDFGCAEYELLKKKYALSEIAGTGSEFERASRLTAHFAPGLTHKGDYAGCVACNAQELLQYSFEQPQHGINCVNKSKILQECCLALGIYARRMWIMPYSPYDYDNHVVNEIFDRPLQKWVMLDMTANGYFEDESKTPLSLLEMRRRFANNLPCFFVKLDSRPTQPFKDSEEEKLYYSKYFAKNLFYLIAEKENCFGEKREFLTFLPLHFNDNAKRKRNAAFRSGEPVKGDFEDCPRSKSCDVAALLRRPE